MTLMDRLDHALAWAFIALVITGLSYSSWKWLSASGRPDFCYVELYGTFSAQLELKAHIPWRSDKTLGIFHNIDELKHEADILNCDIKVR